MNFDLVKLGKTASVLFLALAMAGCGGGDDGPTPEEQAAAEAAARMEMEALSAAQGAAMDAATAAMMASEAAATAVTDVTDDRNADASSFVRAGDAAEAAMAAYMAAKAASDAAAAATTSADAAMHQAAAEAAQADAEAALADTRMYTGMVASAQQALDEAATAAEAERIRLEEEAAAAAAAEAERIRLEEEAAAAAAAEAERLRLEAEAAAEATALADAQGAAMDAAAAAMAASDAAAQAVADVMANMDANSDAFALAQSEASNAMSAYMMAKAASDAAAAASTSADAEAQQEIAENAQDDAEDALADAMTYAGLVTAAHYAAVEAAALSDARTAAMEAASEAMMDSETAAEAVAAQTDNQSADQASYDAAAAAAQTAMSAYMAAKAASDAAVAADTSEAAQAQQEIAETKMGEAADALADAQMYAGMVMTAHGEAVAAAEAAAAEARDLSAAQTAAMDAATAAMKASTYAADAVEAVRANKDVNTSAAAAFARAEDAALDASNAYADAAAANNAAQMAMTSEEAMGHQEDAEAAQRAAELAQANAMSFAEIVSTVQQMMEDAADETEMLADAKRMAGEAAIAARKASDDADAAATLAEAAAPGSSDARNARAAANAAATAAGLAEAADMRAQEATDSGTAMEEQLEAVAQRGVADGQLIVAQNHRDDAEDAKLAALQVQEQRDLENAKEDAQDLFDDATDGVTYHYNAVVTKAGLAAGQATAAGNSATRAARARTDSVNAGKQAALADAASTEAQMSLARAMTAKGEADTALQAAKDATTSEAAEAALADLEDANKALTEEHTGETGAGMDYMAAKTAAGNAARYAQVHVLGVFTAANAYDILAGVVDDASTPTDETKSVAEVRQAEIDSTNGIGAAMAAKARVADGAQITGATLISASWPPNMVDDPGTEDTDESTVETVSITISVDDDSITSDTVGMPEADPVVMPNARRITGVSGFTHGFDISEAGEGENARVIAFTNKKQATAAVTAITPVNLDNIAVVGDQVASLGTKSGNTYTGATYDHDNLDSTAPISGTLRCPSDTECSVSVVGETITVTGYRFSGMRAGRDAEDADPMNDYLVFGIWSDEATGDDAADSFGAFAVGGTDYSVNVANQVTGTAKYSGPAVGAHHITGGPVSFFDGAANLTANFGADDAPGTIEGSIDNIHVDGNPYGDRILLVRADLTDGNADFDGNAVMGPQTSPGLASHRFNGTYSGEFFGGTEDVVGTADVNESHVAPKAVAGTFGVTRTETTGTGAAAVTTTESLVGAFGANKN